jgi:hypothetical protein
MKLQDVTPEKTVTSDISSRVNFRSYMKINIYMEYLKQRYLLDCYCIGNTCTRKRPLTFKVSDVSAVISILH